MEYQTKREIVIGTAAGVVSFGVGAAAGYIFCMRRTRSTLANMEHVLESMDEAVAQAELDLLTLREETEKLVPFVDPDQTSLEEITPLTEDGSSTELPVHVIERHTDEGNQTHTLTVDELPTLDHQRRNVFPATVGDDPNWDYDVEVRARELAPDQPFVLHKNEFEDNDPEYSQSTLTYYEGDDVLTDDHDVPIYDYKRLVGDIKFGKGSGDPNVFYVRNPKLEADYEVLRHTGHYSVEVLGVEIEEHFEHLDRRRVHKFRSDD